MSRSFVGIPVLSRVGSERKGLTLSLQRLLPGALMLMLTANLARIPVARGGSKDAPLLLNDLVVLGMLFLGTLMVLQRRSLRLDTVAALGIVFALVGAFSTLAAGPRFGLNAYELLFSSAYLLRWLLYFGLYLYVLNFVGREEVEFIENALLRAVLVFSCFGIVQSLLFPGFAQMVYPDAALYTGWDPQGHRLVSSFLDPNFAGIFIVIGLMLYLARAAYGEPIPPIPVGLLFTGLILTLSRGSILAFVLGLSAILFVRRPAGRLLRLLLAFGFTLLAASPWIIRFALSFHKFSIDGSALARVVSWVRAGRALVAHPILGVGFNTYGFVQDRFGGDTMGNASFGLDGGLLFIAVMTGFLGFSIYLGMLGVVLVRCRRIWRRTTETPRHRALALGVAAATVAVVFQSLFVNSLLYPSLMETLWILWALPALILRVSAGTERPRNQNTLDLPLRSETQP